MGSLRYWMVFQAILGIWLVFSPFFWGYREITSMTINDTIVGAFMVILGLAVAFAGLPKSKPLERSM